MEGGGRATDAGNREQGEGAGRGASQHAAQHRPFSIHIQGSRTVEGGERAAEASDGEQDEVLGKEHPSTLTSMINLELVLRNQGKYEKTEEMDRQVLAVRERVLGKGAS
jgi:Tetratricopeptide repeat